MPIRKVLSPQRDPSGILPQVSLLCSDKAVLGCVLLAHCWTHPLEGGLPPTPHTPADMFIAECPQSNNLLHVMAIQGWLQKIRTAIVKSGNTRDLLWETWFLRLNGLVKGMRN